MTGKTLSKILNVKSIFYNGKYFFYQKRGRCQIRIEVGKTSIAFFTVWRIYTEEEHAESLRKLSGRIKHRGFVNVKNFRNKEDMERIRKCFERLK